MYYTILSEKEYNDLIELNNHQINTNNFIKIENGWYTDAEHILEFAIFGDFIAEVDVPNHDENFYHYGINTWVSNQITIKNPKTLWDKEVLTRLKNEGANLFADDKILLKLAEIGHHEEVVYFLKAEKEE